jgi:hypothetical protein
LKKLNFKCKNHKIKIVLNLNLLLIEYFLKHKINIHYIILLNQKLFKKNYKNKNYLNKNNKFNFKNKKNNKK